MKTLKTTSLALLIMTLALFVWIPLSYSSSNDDNHLSANDAVYSSLGYLNKAIQQARTLSDKYLSKKDKAEAVLDNTQRDVSYKVKEDAAAKPKPELKQKQSSPGGSNKRLAASQSKLIDSSKYNVNIGSGTDQAYQNGRLISEVINGTRHVYAGFSNVGFAGIQDAVANAGTGDFIIVKEGTYGGFSLTKGVKLYGGYNESGIRDISGTKSTITDTITISGVDSACEINGFNMVASYVAPDPKHPDFRTGISVLDTSTLNILNNTISGFRKGISISGGTVETSSINITNNSISSSVSDWWSSYGIYAQDATLTVNDNNINILGAGTPQGIVIYSTKLTAENNNIYTDNSNAIWSGESTITLRNNEIRSLWGTCVGIDAGTDLYAEGNTIYTEGNALAGYNNSNFSLANNQINSGWGDYIDSGVGVYYIAPRPNTATNTAGTLLEYTTTLNPWQTENWRSYDKLGENALNTWSLYQNSTAAISEGAGTSKFNGLFDSAGNLQKGNPLNNIDPKFIIKLMEKYSNGNAMAMPIEWYGNDGRSEIGIKLASIISNPNKDQKTILDVMASLIGDLAKEGQGSSAKNLELENARNNLLQMAATLLLAQAIPDLLKEGEMANIKGIFADLGKAKEKVMMDYQQSTRLYYDNMIKDMAKNLAILQGRNLLNPNMTKEELSKLPPSELDKILEKIKNMKDKAFEEQYLLQQEAKYRKSYLEPGKQKLEEDTKLMLNNFTGKISGVLKSAEKK